MPKAETVSFTLRIPKALHERLLSVCAATGSEVTRSGLCIQGLEQLLAQLEVCPWMVQGYDPAQDKSARQKEKRQNRKSGCKTEAKDE